MVNERLDRRAHPSQHGRASAVDRPDDRADTASPVAPRAAASHPGQHAPTRPLAENPSAAVDAAAQALCQGGDVIFDVDLPMLHAGLPVIDGPRDERAGDGGSPVPSDRHPGLPHLGVLG
jgi:hypothetical protein